MAYTLNTSHALYGNLIELIGVQSGALVSHKTARTFTKHADASYGTGTYGEHFKTINGGYTAKGASFSPALVRDTYTNPNYSIVLVFNGRSTGSANVAFLNNNGGTYTFSSPTWNNSGAAGIATAYTNSMVSGTTLPTGAFMVTTTRTEGAGNVKLYVGSTLAGTANSEPWNVNTAVNYLGGYDGQGAHGGDLVWAAIFDKVLSSAEITDLYNSLGANNAFGLVSAGGGTPTLTVADGVHAHTVDSISLSVLGTLGVADSTHAHTVDSIALTAASNGTITIPAVRDWGTKALKTGEAGVQVDVRNISTGALVVRKAGQTTHATTGVCVVTDPAIVAGTTYEVVTRFADGSRGMWDYTAT